MGNKNTSLPRGPDAVQTLKEQAVSDDVTGLVSAHRPQSLSPELLASLQHLRENHDDYCLLPQSLHQIAEVFSLKGDYQWAIHFLQLEKLYHERLLSNLASLQEDWERQLRQKDSQLTSDTDGISQKHMETLDHICRTHHRPAVSVNQEARGNRHILQSGHKEANRPEACDGEEDQSTISDSELCSPLMSREEEQDGEKAFEEGLEVEEEEQETPEEEVVKVEWPTGVPQASDKDLAKLSHTERNCCPDGLVSILKRRRASLDGLPPPSSISSCSDKHNSKRKVRFSEPDDGSEQDEVGGDSCLILLLLCFLTVVISVGGTALYCTLVDTYSTICTDFSHNMDLYVSNARAFLQGFGWLPSWT
uniref:Consortin, connexin sorting protein n=1 Tax=Nothobranchius korthausae TaxID=1143690 RepID=A0A1A8GSD3_9TELE